MACLILLAIPAASAQEAGVSARNFSTVQYHWVMHCQGCHGADAHGTPGSVPKLTGNVARFLQTKAGRAYLARVPGVAFVELSDTDVAELLNWVVQRFDPTHVPKAFTPYSQQEIRGLRNTALISNAYLERRRILQSLAASN